LPLFSLCAVTHLTAANIADTAPAKTFILSKKQIYKYLYAKYAELYADFYVRE